MIALSFIVPCYNNADFISRCLQSLTNQTLRNIEIIVVNDGSTDRSKELCEKWAQKDSRITVITQENQGVSVARNTGLKLAQGEYIAFVDGDDRCDSAFAKNMYQTAEQEKADIVICGYWVESTGNVVQDNFFPKHEFLSVVDMKLYLLGNMVGCTQYGAHGATNCGVPWGKVYRRSFLEQKNLLFVPGLKRTQDMIFNFYAVEKANKIVFRWDALYYYRIWSGSNVRKYSPDFGETMFFLMREMERAVEKSSYPEFLQKMVDFKSIQLLFEYMNVTLLHPDSPIGYFEAKHELERASRNELLQNALQRISINQFSALQKVKLSLLKQKKFGVLCGIYWFKNKCKKLQ